MRKSILVSLVVSLAVASPASAQRAHVSVAKARSEIVRYFGPGTVVTKCKRFAPTVIGCDYEMPSANVGIVFEEQANGFKPESGIYYGYATVRTHRARLIVSAP